MTKPVNLIKWEYQQEYNLPDSIRADGSIEWASYKVLHYINLPDNVCDPGKLINESSYDLSQDINILDSFKKVIT
jgi:hypothetical protein